MKVLFKSSRSINFFCHSIFIKYCPDKLYLELVEYYDYPEKEYFSKFNKYYENLPEKGKLFLLKYLIKNDTFGKELLYKNNFMENRVNELKTLFKNKSKQIFQDIKNIFSFKIPNIKLIIFIGYIQKKKLYFAHSFSLKNNWFIILFTNEYLSNGVDLGLIFHEILHILTLKNLKRIKLDPIFLETVLEWFFPRGFYAYKIGIIPENVYNDWKRKFYYSLSWRAKKLYWWFNELTILENFDFKSNIWKFLINNSKNIKIKEICKTILKEIE